MIKPVSKIQVVKAIIADAPLVADILTDAVRRKLTYDDHSWGAGVYTEEEVLRLMAKSPTYLAYVDGEAVGTVALQWEDEPVWGVQPPIAGYIHRLAIKDGVEAKGLGAQMIDWAGNQVARRHRKFLRLDCDIRNLGLCAYYEKQGFVQVGSKQMTRSGHTAALYERQVAV